MVSRVEFYQGGKQIFATKIDPGEAMYLDDFSDVLEKKIYKIECASNNTSTSLTELHENNYYLNGEDVIQVAPFPPPFIQLYSGEEDFVMHLQCVEFGVSSEFRIRHLASKSAEK